MFLTVLFYVFVVVAGIQIIYYLLFSSILVKNKKEVITSNEYPISVIVYNKNNGDSLRNNLPNLLNQKYSKFEILILDSSTDDNDLGELILDFVEKHNNLKIIKAENNKAFWGNKKYALTLGIKAAKYDHLLFTDARTKVLSTDWINSMSTNFTKTKTINLGYRKLSKSNSFLNLLARFENVIKATQCFSFLKINNSFMAFGDNLSYDRQEFFNVKGFIYHIKVTNGEDDLFIRDAATKENITYTLDANSFVENEAPESITGWISSLKSNKSLQKHYKIKQRLLLNLFSFTKLLFYVFGTISFFFFSWQIILPIVLSYFLIQFVVVGLLAKKLQEPYIVYFLPILEISLVLIQISIFIANSFSKTSR